MRSRTTQTQNAARRGFSLIELVIVIVIIGIIAAIAIPRVSKGASNADINSTKASLAAVRNAIELYKAENNSYPATNTALVTALTTQNAAGYGPYLQSIPVPTISDTTIFDPDDKVAVVGVGTAARDAVTTPAECGWAYVLNNGVAIFYLNAQGSTAASAAAARNW